MAASETKQKAEDAIFSTKSEFSLPRTLFFICLHIFYLYANFVPFFAPILLYLAIFRLNPFAMLVLCVCIVDLLVPLKFPGLNEAWCRFCQPAVDGKKGFFPIENVFELHPSKFPKDKNYLVCAHPHSLYFIGYDTMAYEFHNYGFNSLFAGADVIFMVPILRRIMTWWGCVPATKESIMKHLTSKFPYNMLYLTPGGISEMFCGETSDGKGEVIVAKRRKGHIKLALKAGASIVPCYGLGATQFVKPITTRNSWFHKTSRKLRVSIFAWVDALGIPYGLIPIRKPMVMVVGQPIHVEKVANPTQKQIDALHKKYLDGLVEIFDKYKGRLGPEWESKQLLFEDFDQKKKDN